MKQKKERYSDVELLHNLKTIYKDTDTYKIIDKLLNTEYYKLNIPTNYTDYVFSGRILHIPYNINFYIYNNNYKSNISVNFLSNTLSVHCKRILKNNKKIYVSWRMKLIYHDFILNNTQNLHKLCLPKLYYKILSCYFIINHNMNLKNIFNPISANVTHYSTNFGNRKRDFGIVTDCQLEFIFFELDF